MKVKRYLLGIIILKIFLISIPCFAAEGTEIEPVKVHGNIVTVSGTVAVSKARTYIQITRQGAELLDADNIYASRQITAGENGKFSVKCEMPLYDRVDSTKPVDGVFTVYVAAAGDEIKHMDFFFALEANRVSFLQNMNSAKSSSQESLWSFMTDRKNEIYYKAYNILIDEFYNLDATRQKIVTGAIKDVQISIDENNISTINNAIIASRLNGLQNQEAVKNILESPDIASRCTLTFNENNYTTLDSDKKDWFHKMVLNSSKSNSFKEVSQLDLLFDESMILYNINHSHYSDLFSELSDNAEILRLDECPEFAKIKALSDKETVMKNLKALSSNITGVEELHTKITQAYNNSLKKDDDSNNNSNSGQSSRKSSITYGSIPATTTTTSNEPVEIKKYFSDLSDYTWAEEAINNLAAENIISGYGEGIFAPEKNVTRAEFLKMLITAINLLNNEASSNFSDVPADDWSYPYIASAYAEGITSGIDETTFGKDNLVTRQEAAAFMHRAAARAYLPITTNTADSFADSDEIAYWAKRSVNIMQASGLISGVGDNHFSPNAYTTRAEAAKMIYGIYLLARG